MGRRTAFVSRDNDFLILKKGASLRVEKVGDAFRLVTMVQEKHPNGASYNTSVEIILDKDEANQASAALDPARRT